MLHLSVQFIKFGIVGGINTLIDFSVYIFLTRLFTFWSHHLVFATVVAFLCAAVNSYILNKRWTFQNEREDHHILFTKFLVVTASSFLIYSTLFATLVHLGFYDLYVKVLLVAFVAVWNFVFSKFWVYTRGNHGQTSDI